jgi:hypothetical protein
VKRQSRYGLILAYKAISLPEDEKNMIVGKSGYMGRRLLFTFSILTK